MFYENSRIYGEIMESGSWNPVDVEISPNCPRCGSTNTKFCYYNNYSLGQPRYFCKGCKRYWTKGGSLRNIPVGGGCRKSRKSKFGHRCSRSLPVGTSSEHDQRFTSRLSESSRSVTGSGDSGRGDGCNIDIASVYSNFLNPKPEPHPEPEFPQVSYNKVSPLFNYVSNFHDEENVHLEFLVESRNLLSWSDYPSNDDENGLNFYGFDSTEEGQPEIINNGFMGMINVNNYVLPPLPDGDVMSDGLVWPSSDMKQSGQDPNQVSDQSESLLGGISTYGIFSGPGK